MAKKNLYFKTLDSLTSVQNVLNEAAMALSDKTRTISTSSIPTALTGAVGAATGGVVSFAALYLGRSVAGLSAAGITSGLAAAGAIVGGGMAAGVAVLAAPVAVLAAGAVGLTMRSKHKKLANAKQAMYQEALRKQNAILAQLQQERNADKDRVEYLNSLNELLKAAIRDLRSDLELS